MKILFLNYELGSMESEAGEATLALLAEYAKIPEMEIDLVTSSIDGKYHELKMGENVAIYRIPNKNILGKPAYQSKKEPLSFIWQAYKFSRTLAKKRQYDLCHVFFSETFGRIALMLKWEFKLPFIVSLQGSDNVGYMDREIILSKFKKPISQKIFAKASFLIANSLWLREWTLLSGLKKEIELIYNGFDAQSIFPDQSKRDSEKFVVICDTKIEPIMGLRFMIQALKLLAGRYDQIRLLIVGDGNEKQSLEDLARALGIKDKVRFMGEVPAEKIAGCYQQADLFVSTSLEDGINMKIAKACAAGLPIVAMDTVWTREILRDGFNCLLAKNNEADDLADKIERFVLDKELRDVFSKNNLSQVEQFSWRNAAKKYFNIYTKTKNIKTLQD
ncbi:MAG: glycosyltransferase family 4 protein [Candidatus Moranbacteria bacterium]|nr:glycosyltransferase family 4 protein [Candidatus Moranbacteria bacterium]